MALILNLLLAVLVAAVIAYVVGIFLPGPIAALVFVIVVIVLLMRPPLTGYARAPRR